MRHRLHQIGIGCILPITLPLDAERIVLMIAHRDLQVRQVDLALEPSRGRNADMVETRSREYPHFFLFLSLHPTDWIGIHSKATLSLGLGVRFWLACTVIVTVSGSLVGQWIGAFLQRNI